MVHVITDIKEMNENNKDVVVTDNGIGIWYRGKYFYKLRLSKNKISRRKRCDTKYIQQFIL